jgi:hypothetical protein
MVVLGKLGVASDMATGLAFLPALVIFLWNRAKDRDRLQGLAAPTLAFCTFLSLGGFTQYKQGVVFETLHVVGLVGIFLSVGWLLWFLLFLGGPAKRLIDK